MEQPNIGGIAKHDWDKIQADWEDVLLSNRQIADKYKISYDYLTRQCKQRGWKRGQRIRERIRDRTEEKLNLGMITLKEINTDGDQVETAANQAAEIIQNERIDVIRARQIARGLMEELAIRSMTEEQRTQIVDVICHVQGRFDRANVTASVKIFLASLDLGTRIKMMQQLSMVMETFINLERKVYGLDDTTDEPPYEQALAQLKSISAELG